MALLCCYKAATSDQTGWHTDHFLEENYKAGCTHWSTGSFCSCVRRHWQTQIRAEHRVCLPDNYVVLTQWNTKRNTYISADRQVRQPRRKAKQKQKTGSVLPFCKSKLIGKSSFQHVGTLKQRLNTAQRMPPIQKKSSMCTWNAEMPGNVLQGGGWPWMTWRNYQMSRVLVNYSQRLVFIPKSETKLTATRTNYKPVVM